MRLVATALGAVLLSFGCAPPTSSQAESSTSYSSSLETISIEDATLDWPSGIAVDSLGRIYVAERRADRIRLVDLASGTVATIVGTGERGYSGDGGLASEAQIAIPELIALDGGGNLYIADRENSRIRRVDATTGVISTVAGTGRVGYSGDGGLAIEADLSYPFGVVVDPGGNLYIADTENHVIRRVEVSTGIITTVAGSGGAGFSGDGGPAIEAQLNRPHNMAIGPDGQLVIGDSQNQRIREVDPQTGVISTLYGSGEQGVSPDDILARDAAFSYFGSLVFAPYGDLLLTGWVDNRVRRIDAATGIITTVAGTTETGELIEDGSAEGARLSGPYGLALDGNGNLYVAEAQANRIRRIDVEAGRIATVVGQ